MANESDLPIIFLAFANEQEDPDRVLRKLGQEQRKISESLRLAEQRGICVLEERSNATIEDILDVFREYGNRIAIFHYGGHADGYQLLLESEEGKNAVAHGGGLVSFFRQQDGLKLIFLNGCSTNQQAEELIDAGIPAVIGTGSAIEDDAATNLSTTFYKSLSEGSTLDKAWNEAKSAMEIKYGEENYQATYRSIFLDTEEPPDSFPWDFLCHSDSIKSWNLPEAANNPLFGLPKIPQMDLPEEPFRLLQPYDEIHAPIFFGRGRYIKDLFEKVYDPPNQEGEESEEDQVLSPPLVLLHGQSASGKTSLLLGGVIPRLRQVSMVHYLRVEHEKGLLDQLEEPFRIWVEEEEEKEEEEKEKAELSPVNKADEEKTEEGTEAEKEPDRPIEQLVEAFNQALEKQDLPIEARRELRGQLKRLTQLQKQIKTKVKKGKKNTSQKKQDRIAQRKLFRYLKAAWLAYEKAEGKPVILVLDEIDNMFTNDEQSSQKIRETLAAFMKAIHTIFADPKDRPMGKVVVSYRKEYHSEIISYCKKFKIPRDTLFLDQLDEEGIVEIVEKISELYEVELAPDLAQIIANDLRKDTKSSISEILQILLTRLWRMGEKGTEHVFSKENYKNLGRGVREFVIEQLKKLKPLNNSGTAGNNLLMAPEFRGDKVTPEEFKRLNVMEASGLVLDILFFHTTSYGTAKRYNRTALYNRYALIGEGENEEKEYDEDRVKDIEIAVKGLNYLGLLRDAEAKFTTLTHDNLAPYIDEAFRKSGRPGQRAMRILLWKKETATELTERELAILEKGEKGMPILGEKETQIIEKSKKLLAEAKQEEQRSKLVKRVLVFSIMGLILLTGFYITNRNQKNQETKARLLQQSLANVIQVQAANATKTDPTLAFQLLWEGTKRDTTNSLKPKLNATFLKPDLGLYIRKTNLGSRVQDFKYSPDGTHLLMLRGRGAEKDEFAQLELYNQGGKRMQTYPPRQQIRQFQFSPDTSSKTILMLSRTPDIDQTLASLWNYEGRMLQTFQSKDSISAISYSPDGRNVFTGEENGSIYMWNLKGELVQSFESGSSLVSDFVFPANDSSFLSVHEKRDIFIWHKQEAKVLSKIRMTPSIKSLTLSPSDSQLLVLDNSENSILINLNTLERKKVGQGGSLLSTFWDSDSSLLQIQKDQCLITDLNGNTIETIWEQGEYKDYKVVSLSPDKQKVLLKDKSNKYLLWNLDHRINTHLVGHKGELIAAGFSPSEEHLFTLGKDQNLILWPTQKGKRAELIKNNLNVASMRRLSGEGGYLTKDEEGCLSIWNMDGYLAEHINTHPGDSIICSAISEDGNYIAMSCKEKGVILWDVEQEKSTILQERGNTLISAVAISQDGNLIGTGKTDGELNIWKRNRNGYTHIGKFNDNIDRINSLTFSADNNKLISATDHDGAVMLDIESEEFQKLGVRIGGAKIVACSDDGEYIATVSNENKMTLWDLEGRHQHVMLGHESTILSVSFSPNSQNILTVDSGHRIILWNTEGQVLQYLVDPKDHIKLADFHPSGNKIITVSEKGNMKFWLIDSLNDNSFNNRTLAALSIDQKLRYGIKVDDLKNTHDHLVASKYFSRLSRATSLFNRSPVLENAYELLDNLPDSVKSSEGKLVEMNLSLALLHNRSLDKGRREEVINQLIETMKLPISLPGITPELETFCEYYQSLFNVYHSPLSIKAEDAYELHSGFVGFFEGLIEQHGEGNKENGAGFLPISMVDVNANHAWLALRNERAYEALDKIKEAYQISANDTIYDEKVLDLYRPLVHLYLEEDISFTEWEEEYLKDFEVISIKSLKRGMRLLEEEKVRPLNKAVRSHAEEFMED